MPSAFTQSDLFTLLADGQIVLVPHAHAARVLRSRFQQHAKTLQIGKDPGTLLAWPEWTASVWSTLLLEGAEDRVLLNRTQEELLWSSILTARPTTGPITPSLPSRPQTQLARSGLRLAAAYNATDRLRTAADTTDTRTFAAWVDAFRDLCTRRHLLAPALLEHALTLHLRSGTLPAPAALHLVGFERLTPAQRDLLSALEAAGTQIHLSHLRHHAAEDTKHLIIATPDPREQLRFAARWVAQQATQSPATFALLTPRPQDHRPELERFLREALTPELEPVTADLSSTPWQFAARPPLTSATLITHALRLLRWTAEPLPVDHISHILLSPYFSFTDSLEQRARAEAHLRCNTRLLRPELELDQFQQLVTSSARKASTARFPEFLTLRKLLDPKTPRPATRLSAEWADHVRALLAALGWPGPRALNPTEFAAFGAWESLLDLLSTLDLIGRRLPLPSFLQRLEDEAAQATFAVPAPTAPIQILTLPETEALPFDHVLVLDATDAHLPPPETLHPLLSRRLQRSLDMPGADPAGTYALTRHRLEALIARSSTLHLVAPAEDAAGTLRPTRLAQDLQNLPFNPADSSTIFPDLSPIPTLPTTEVVETGSLPPLPSPVVHGGARVLELQSACGFRAFADLRLRAEEPASPALGLNHREAGSRLHDALQKLWAELKDQATLRALPTPDRLALIRQAVRSALVPLAGNTGAERPWPQAFLRILEERFIRLLHQWLDVELKRAPFTPLAQEQSRQITVGPLQFNIRPDRIDQVANGLVFIDYKTAYTLSTDHWLGERPDAPQLPLYTLLEDPETVRGLAFAQVRSGKDMGWHSLSDTPGLFPRNANNTQAQLTEEIELWREELTRLARAFADGEASVNPKTYPKTCEYCAQRLLCRLDPSTLLAQTTEDDEEDELEEPQHA